jgi:DNA-directed RNA polymerase specialized sigma24 family protein
VKAELVQLRYFAGLTLEQAAQVLGISLATAERYWAFTRAWLLQELTGDAAAPGPHP